MSEQTPPDQEAFAREAARGRQGILREFWEYLRNNKKWWLAPILVMLLAVGILIALGSSVVAPLTYPLF